MSRRRTALTLALAALGLLVLASSATAAPVLNLDIHHNPTHFAPGNPGSAEVSTDAEGSPASNEVQLVEVSATSGQFRLSFGADTTTDLAFNATANQVRDALRALPSIGSPNVNVSLDTSGDIRTYRVTFVSALARTDVAQISASSGTSPLRLSVQYWFDLANVGSNSTVGPITLTVDLPAGITFDAVAGSRFKLSDGWRTANGGIGDVVWSCPASPGATHVVCTAPGPIPPHTTNDALALAVSVDPAATGVLDATATASGGGSASVSVTEPTPIEPDPAPFGIFAPSFTPDFFEADGLTAVRRSGAHPALFTVPFDLNSVVNDIGAGTISSIPNEHLRDVSVDLPPGFLGNPTAVGECTQAVFTLGECPGSTQVGRIDAQLTNNPTFALHIGLFNLVHPRGALTDLGLAVIGNPVHIKASLDPANRYAITTTTADINETLPAIHQRLTVWGVPADHSHDSERCDSFKRNFSTSAWNNGDTSRECSTDLEPKPFLTVPSACGIEHQVRLHHYDSWQDRGDFGPDIVYTQPGPTTDCDVPRFEPAVELVPTGREAASPTGLDIHIKLPQNDNPNALATPPVKSTVVTFPQGMTVNPAFADGLNGCTLAEIGLGTNDPVDCPDNSRIGEVFLTTPLLPRPLEGSMYLAKQKDNPFGSTFAMYMAVHDLEERGILVKIPGRIDLDQRTGQIVTTFDDLPQFPFDDFTLSFRSGQRAPLMNPPSCGTQRIGIEVASYAQPNNPVDASNTYEVSEGPGGSPCPASLGTRPFDPQMDAGATNPVAGAHSPFVFRLTRTDAEQDISKVTVDLPAGLTAKLAGVDICPDSAIAQISTAEGQGAVESANPHCPQNSLVGQLNAGVGSGTNPNYFKGKAYLAGPYRGAPLSFITVVPAIAGPYDFGNVVVRVAAQIDPKTAEVTAVSDPFPPLVHGVLLHVRDIRLVMNRDQFTLNPTSCDEMTVDAQILSDLGALASPSNRFQVGDCGSLQFKPKLNLRLRGGTKRGAHPALTATLVPRPGDANIASISVAFPRSEFLENAHIRTVCTRADFAASNCPAGAIYGRATAYTPILGYPLEANVYLRSSSNLLPDVVPDFRGPQSQPIRFESAGRVDSVNGGIRNTFDFIPDAPISRVLFRLQGGKKGLLVNSRDICAKTYRAKVRFSAHNGLTHTIRPKMRASCGKGRRGKRGKRRGQR